MLVAPRAANARKLGAALAEFGFAKLAADGTWFTKPYRVTMLGRIPLRKGPEKAAFPPPMARQRRAFTHGAAKQFGAPNRTFTV